VLSGIPYNRLSEYADEILGDYQCGFHANCSTVDHIFAISLIQEKAYNIHLHNLYIYFKQASDSVNRGRVLNDLMISGIPKKLVQLIDVTMARSKAIVRVDNQYTSAFPITNGVRQGDALSFILFDLVSEAILQKVNITGYIGTKSTQIFAYADDVVLVSRNKNALKDTLVNIESEARERGLLINENKTKHMEVTRTVVNGDHLRCGKRAFEHVKELSYLGS
jgi:sorting nexin-29